MRFFRICLTLFLMALFVVSAHAEPVSKKFTKEEIKKMSETKAVIETKLGNIELRFFPDVAPPSGAESGVPRRTGVSPRCAIPTSVLSAS